MYHTIQTPMSRTILQFQFADALCSVSGHTGPLHRYCAVLYCTELNCTVLYCTGATSAQVLPSYSYR